MTIEEFNNYIETKKAKLSGFDKFRSSGIYMFLQMFVIPIIIYGIIFSITNSLWNDLNEGIQVLIFFVELILLIYLMYR